MFYILISHQTRHHLISPFQECDDLMSQLEEFSKTSNHWWCVADEPFHRGGSHEATISETSSMVSGGPQSNFHSPFPPPLMTEPPSGSLQAAMSSAHYPNMPGRIRNMGETNSRLGSRQPWNTIWATAYVALAISNFQAPYGSPFDPSADAPHG